MVDCLNELCLYVVWEEDGAFVGCDVEVEGVAVEGEEEDELWIVVIPDFLVKTIEMSQKRSIEIDRFVV